MITGVRTSGNDEIIPGELVTHSAQRVEELEDEIASLTKKVRQANKISEAFHEATDIFAQSLADRSARMKEHQSTIARPDQQDKDHEQRAETSKQEHHAAMRTLKDEYTAGLVTLRRNMRWNLTH